MLTIGDLLKAPIDPTLRSDVSQYLYIVRDSDTVLYVGQTTRSIRRRIKDHIIARHWNDHFGCFYTEHYPQSNNWTVEVVYVISGLYDAENEAIGRLCPVLNKQRPPRKITQPFVLAERTP